VWDESVSALYERMGTMVEAGDDGVLVTIADVAGNAYRRPGAKMLVSATGDKTGSVTAGCLEDSIQRLCENVIETRTPLVEIVDVTNDDGVWGLGVGCNGIVTLLLEPITAAHRPLVEAYTSRTPIAAVTVLPDKGYQEWHRLYVRPDTEWSPSQPEWLQRSLNGRAIEFAHKGKASLQTLEGPDRAVDVFVDGVSPPPTLVIVGSGTDVRPLIQIANGAGFRTVVVGFRGGKATTERYLAADEVIPASPRELSTVVDIDENTYVCVMTHNFVDDSLAVAELEGTPTPYIGVMGPASRFEKIKKHLRTDQPSRNIQLDSIYTPVGLDLGGGEPYQIALSIVAEVLAVHNGRTVSHLRNRDGHIHDRPTK